MSSRKQYKLAEKRAGEQQRVILELNALVKSIERCVKTVTDLKSELELVNAAHQGSRTTRQEIDYLTELLKCAHKKLATGLGKATGQPAEADPRAAGTDGQVAERSPGPAR